MLDNQAKGKLVKMKELYKIVLDEMGEYECYNFIEAILIEDDYSKSINVNVADLI